jgi:hypothetical protein
MRISNTRTARVYGSQPDDVLPYGIFRFNSVAVRGPYAYSVLEMLQ